MKELRTDVSTISAPERWVSDEQLAEMLTGCEGVTPGPWIRSGVRHRMPEEEDCLWVGSDGYMIFGTPVGNEKDRPAAFRDAGHIARCDPATIRALVTEVLASRAASPPSPSADARVMELETALEGLLNNYITVMRDGDLADGRDPEEHDVVKIARTALTPENRND